MRQQTFSNRLLHHVAFSIREVEHQVENGDLHTVFIVALLYSLTTIEL